MLLHHFVLDDHKSVRNLEFQAGPFTVLFGLNNAGKTNILEAIADLLDPSGKWGARRTPTSHGSHVRGGVTAFMQPGSAFDDAVSTAASKDTGGQ